MATPNINQTESTNTIVLMLQCEFTVASRKAVGVVDAITTRGH